jgi:macrolide transport system ATP-binding/permease protein
MSEQSAHKARSEASDGTNRRADSRSDGRANLRAAESRGRNAANTALRDSALLLGAWLVGGFAAMALILGVFGVYGVIAYSVSQRTREIGIRMALGAERSSIYRLVMQEAERLTGAGLAMGLVCSVGASLLTRSLLFGVEAWDPTTLVCVVVLLGLASLAASFLPARRAASVNPMDALRSE